MKSGTIVPGSPCTDSRHGWTRPATPPAANRLPRGSPSGALAALVLLSTSLALAAIRDATPDRIAPRTGDHTLLSWREGPPYITNASPADVRAAGYSPERRFLRMATGHFTADFDTERISVCGFARHTSPLDEAAAVRSVLEADPLASSRLQMEISAGGVVYACRGRRPVALDPRGLPSKALEFPVRLVESGRFFQKFTLHNLEFADREDRILPVDARIEVSAWPDRLAMTLVARTVQPLPKARIAMRLHTSDDIVEKLADTGPGWSRGAEERIVLSLDFSGRPEAAGSSGVAITVTPGASKGRATVSWNPEELCHSVRLESAQWPGPKEGNYPESMLDAWDVHSVTLENPDRQPRRLGLAFDHVPPKSVIAYVPMLLDEGGKPTGIPVQISKNWHRAKDGTALTHAGPWMHGRTWINLPAESRIVLRYGTTYARWGGLPAASVAQLSLIGWGHNGFWDQFALGGFGESFCFQPARVMRRCLVTDFRPLFQLGFGRGHRWAWTSNVGGADAMVIVDPRGRYVPFKRNATRYASHGPNIARLHYDEVAHDGSVRCGIEVMLPRTDDCVRVFMRVRCEVLKPVPFSRLALFQLGADFYNDTSSPVLAWGSAAGLEGEHRPAKITAGPLHAPWEARGEQPWMSLHGQDSSEANRVGEAVRGLVVREWRAVLGGGPVPAPHFAAAGSLGSRPHLAGEIVAPPGLTALIPGDRVEMLVELLALPISVERYYGPDAALRAALAAGANTWRMVHREASLNRPVLATAGGTELQGWPLTLPAGIADEVSFTLRGGLGHLPVTITGIERPSTAELFRVTPLGRERVWQGTPGRAFWQCDHDASTMSWSLSYNLPSTPAPASYVLRMSEPVAPATIRRPSRR